MALDSIIENVDDILRRAQAGHQDKRGEAGARLGGYQEPGLEADQAADLMVGARGVKTLEEIREVIRAHQDELHRRYKARVVGIFGSYVRGEQREDSDLDLLAEFDKTASLLDLGGAQVLLSELLGVKVDLVPREDIRPELKDSIESAAVEV